jgi:hypothetical protein
MQCRKCGGQVAWFTAFTRKCLKCGTLYPVNSPQPRPFTLTEKGIRRVRRVMEALAKRQWEEFSRKRAK